MGSHEDWRHRLGNWPQWPFGFRLLSGLLALLAFGSAALFDANGGANPRDYAEGVPGSYVGLHSARWLDLGPEPVDAPSLSPLPIAVMEAHGATVVLPHHLPKNVARASISWYSMSLMLPTVAPGTPASGVCVPRWSSSASVWLDGKQLVASAIGVHGMHDWSRPQYIGFPAELAPGIHRLDLRLRAMPALAPGLSEIWFGDGPLIRRACESLSEKRELRIVSSGLLIGVMGLMALIMALVLRDASAGWFALMALMWVTQLMVARGLGASLSEQHWTMLYFAIRTAFVVPLFMFCLRISKQVRPKLERLMLFTYGGAIVLLLVLPPQYCARWLTVMGVSLLASMPYFLAVLMRHALRRPVMSSALLAAALGVILLTSVLDILRLLGMLPFSNASLSILAMPLLSFAFAVLLCEKLIDFVRSEMLATDMLRLQLEHQAELIATVQAERKQAVEQEPAHDITL